MDKSSLDTAIQGMQTSHSPAAANDGAGDVGLFSAELDLFEGHRISPPRRGRPPGSPNRTTVQLQKLLLAKGYRDPAEFLAAIQSMDVADLAEALACDKIAAATLQVRAAEKLMPYFHQMLPQAVEVKGDAPRKLIVMGDLVQNILQNQGVSESDDRPPIDISHSDLSQVDG